MNSNKNLENSAKKLIKANIKKFLIYFYNVVNKYLIIDSA